MTNRPDIALTTQTTGWVEITNIASGKQYAPTIRFLEANRKHFSLVAFGPIASHAIKSDRVPAFIAYARKCGFSAEVGA
jgi:hypothetical protein